MEQIVTYKNDHGNGYSKTQLSFLQLFTISHYLVLVASEQILDCIQEDCGHDFAWHTTGSGYMLASFNASTLLKDGHINAVIGLPANLFYSTGIPVCILVLKRCKKTDDVLFINAAENFIKGKRQNQLAPEHIEAIIDTYQHRKEEARYARRVSIKEIEKNDFNLNISRYISTDKGKEEIDLQAVHKELVALETTIQEARDKHNSFLQELGLPLLP